MTPVPSHEAIDEAYASTIARLLVQPTPQEIQAYYSKITDAHHYSGVEVRYIDSVIGKGVIARKNYDKDELVLKEHMLVGGQHTQNKADAFVCSFCFRFIGSIELQIGRRILLTANEGTALYDEPNRHDSECIKFCCSSSKAPKRCDEDRGHNGALLLGVAESLFDGSIHLPFSNHFSLPPAIPCLGGCGEEFYCSEMCAKEAWDTYHSLLCTGPESLCKGKDHLSKFIAHANETNDIFLVAAKVVSSTILKALKLKGSEDLSHLANRESHEDGTWELLKAWEPFSMGFKRLWWNSVALPPDIGLNDEVGFRNQLKELASHSLTLLKHAIFHVEYAALFSLQVYGNIIGMFELNNLDLVVASPVEDYFLYVDDLPPSQKMEAEEITEPLLDALGDDYNAPCEGTAFFPIQSCLNHSCDPNLKAFKRDKDIDGQAVLLATRAIQSDEELTISYIDEEASWEERQAMLEDYGFICQCQKCIKKS